MAPRATVPSAPFTQGRFADLPALPRQPHPWMTLPVYRLPVVSGLLGSTDVAVREVGEGPPLVLVHGLMTSGYSWRYVVEALSSSHRVIIPDLPGAGETVAQGRMSAPALAEWLGVFLHAAGARGAPVIGNSMGGYLGMHLALMDPDALGSLLVVHAPGVVTPRMRALHVAMRLPLASWVLGGLVSVSPTRWVHANVHYRDESLKSLEEASVYGQPLSTRAGRAGFASWLRDGLDARTMAAFERALAWRRQDGEPFPVPIHLLYATTDPMVPPSVGRRLAKLLPGVPITWLDDSSHFAHVDTPGPFLDAVEAWLASTASGT